MGKSLGKTLLTLGAAAFGFYNAGAFGFASSAVWSGAIAGAALGSSIWAATHKPKTTQSYTQFDQLNNSPSTDSHIPVIYGQRKWAGPELWHSASTDGKVLTRDILIGEGEIDNIYGVCANGLLVTGKPIPAFKSIWAEMEGITWKLIPMNAGHVFSIGNQDYPDATVAVTSKNLVLYANGVTTNIPLGNTRDDITYFDYNVSIDKLIGHLGTMGGGWVVVEPTGCTNGTTEIKTFAATPCYVNPVSMEVTGLTDCSYVFHNGSPTQDHPSNYETVGGYKNMAYLRVTLTQSDKLSGGSPTITYIVNGKKIADTRTNAYEVSSNPAMCVRDFLLSKRYGVAKFVPNIADIIDEESFKEVADYCDELVYYRDSNGFLHKEARYATNIILDQKRNVTDTLSELFASFGGFLILSNGKIALRIEKPDISSYHFTNDTIVEKSLTVEQLSKDDTCNQWKLGYFDPTQGWTQVKVLVEDLVDQQPEPIGCGAIITKEVTLSGCTSQSQTIRIGKIYKNLGKLCSLVVTFKTTTFAMHLQPGDIIDITYDKIINGASVHAIDNMPFRILEIQQQDGQWSIKARQYNDSIYGDVTETIQIKDYVPIASPLSSDVPDVVNLDIFETFRELGNGVITSDARITWTSIDPFYKEAEVYVLSDNPTWSEIETSINDLEGTWESIGNNSGSWKLVGKATDELFMTNLVKGLTYTFKVVSVNTVNRKATFDTAPEISIVIKSKTYTPSTPRGLQVSITDKCEWYWNALDLDCDFAELRMNDDTGNITGLLAKTSSTKATVTPPSRHGVAYLYAHNTAGLYSYPCVLEYNKEAPSAPTTVTLTDVFQGVVVTTEALPLYCLGINVYVNDGTGDKVFFSANNSHTFSTTGGIFDISVAFVDIFGEGAKSAVVEKVVKATIDPAWLAAESLSLEKMNHVIKDAVEKAQVSVDTTTFNTNVSRLEAEKTSRTEFTDTVNQLIQVDTSNASAIQQTATAINATIVSNKVDADGKISKVASDLTQTSQSLTSTIQSNKTNIEGKLTTATTQIKQTTDGIVATVQSNKVDADGKISTVGSQIDQQATQITSVVTGLNNANTAIAQTNAAVQLRATKADLISLINVCPEAITILSKFIHISGDTLFDDNVIVGRMLKAGVITADKIAAGAITAETLGVTELSAITAKIGTLRTATTGARTEIKDNLIQVYDANNILRVRMGVW